MGITTEKIAAFDKAEAMVRVRCTQCKAELLLESQRVAFRKQDYGDAVIAVAVTGNVPGTRALSCPYCGRGKPQSLERVS
jgi:DNA-directed RNA polymerase subunit RPC12/RpoP